MGWKRHSLIVAMRLYVGHSDRSFLHCEGQINMTNARSVLNKLIWDKRFDISNYAVVFVHRGAPHDLKVVRGSAIKEIGRSFFIIEEDTMIPYHRIRAIRDLRNGEDIYTKNEGVPFHLSEIEGHESLGEFRDEYHGEHLSQQLDSRASAIRCGARLSFPEDDPDRFVQRVKDAAKKLKQVELSFFRYNGDARESDKYESMVDFAAKVMTINRLDVISLHLPNVNPLDLSRTRSMIAVFLPLCTRVKCSSIVVHPGLLDQTHVSRADRDQARAELAEILRGISDELEDSNVTLSIETYPEKNRVPSGTLDMHDFVSGLTSPYRIAYDTSHTIGNTDSVIEDILCSIEMIRVFHFSNRSGDERHIPIFSPKGDLNFKKIIEAIKSADFRGMIILEYQPKKYRALLESDLNALTEMINQP